MGVVLVTGASSGLGAEMARQFAALGHDLGSVRRDPAGAVTTVLRGLDSANGVVVAPDRGSLLFAETTGHRIARYPCGTCWPEATPIAWAMAFTPDGEPVHDLRSADGDHGFVTAVAERDGVLVTCGLHEDDVVVLEPPVRS